MPGLLEFFATADSEASDAKSPHFEGDAGAEVSSDTPGGVGTAPMEHVEVEEVEEEDLDVHFKRKRQDGSRRKRVVKKLRRYTPTIIGEGESTVAPPPPPPLVIKLSAPRQTAGKAVPDPSKISSVLAIHSYIFHTAHCLLPDSGTEAVRDPRAEVVGEQGEHYDPLFTCREGDEASYFAVSEESGGDAANVCLLYTSPSPRDS